MSLFFQENFTWENKWPTLVTLVLVFIVLGNRNKNCQFPFMTSPSVRLVQFLFLWVCTNLESSEKECVEGTFQIWYTLTLDWLLNVILDRMTRRSAQARNFYAGQLSWTNWPLRMRAVYFRREETRLENYKEWCGRVVMARLGNEDVAGGGWSYTLNLERAEGRCSIV